MCNDSAAFGVADSILYWSPSQQLAGYRRFECVFPTRAVLASADPVSLPSRPRDVSGVRYEVDGEVFDLDGFRTHNHVVGFLVIKNDTLVHEQYDRGNTEDTRWVSFSIAKSVVSLLIGAAIRDGYIASVDDSITNYLPKLRGTSYEGVTLRHALQMASGIVWNEDYTDPMSDVSQEIGLTSLDRLLYLGLCVKYVARLLPIAARSTLPRRCVSPGVVVETLARRRGSWQTTIWQPFGMEAEATWMLVEAGGAEHGGCCLSATLRDYGRIGLFALRNGRLRDGMSVLPDAWMAAATAPSPAADEYGYLWWLRGEDVYAALGIFGQAIWVDPAARIVIVTHSTWPRPTGREFSAHRDAFFRAVTVALEEGGGGARP